MGDEDDEHTEQGKVNACQEIRKSDRKCEGSGDVVGVLTLLVGGVAQAFHDDRVVELRVQLGVQEVEGKRQGGTGRSRKGEASQRGCAMMMTMDECGKT